MKELRTVMPQPNVESKNGITSQWEYFLKAHVPAVLLIFLAVWGLIGAELAAFIALLAIAGIGFALWARQYPYVNWTMGIAVIIYFIAAIWSEIGMVGLPRALGRVAVAVVFWSLLALGIHIFHRSTNR